MPVVFSPAIIQLILYFAVLAIIIAVAVYVVGLFRAESAQKELTAEDHLNNFRELNSQGKLSEAEFRIIKKQLAFQIVDEEKNKTTPSFDPAALLSRGMNSSVNRNIVFSENAVENTAENPDDTRLPGRDAGDTLIVEKKIEH